MTLALTNPGLTGIEVHFPPDKETRLREFATRAGKDAAQLIEEAVDRMLDYEERFLAAVEEGRACFSSPWRHAGAR